MSAQPDFATRPRPARWPWVQRVLLAAGVLALCLAAVLAWRVREQSAEARARLAEARREREQHAARVRALSSFAGSSPAAVASPARIVAALSSVLPPDVRVTRLSIDYAHGSALELTVEARDAGGWDRLLARLERAPEFSDVAPGPESRDGELRSVIRVRWSGGAR